MLRTKNSNKKKKERLISSLNEDNFNEIDGIGSNEIEEVEMIDFERRKMKHSMRESSCFEEGRHEHERGGTSSQPCGADIKRGPI